MQRHHSLIGLLVIGLFLHSGNAVLLQLSHLNFDGPNVDGAKQDYLPTSAQDVPINDEQQQDPQPEFDESSYGNGNYQIFEVHNHYNAQQQQEQQSQETQQSSYHAPSYQPPAPIATTQKIHIQHVSSPNTVDDDLDVSFVSFAAAAGVGAPPPQPPPSPLRQQRRRRLSAKALMSLAAPVRLDLGQVAAEDYQYKGPDYLPPVQQQQQQQHVAGEVQQQQQHFKGPDYLPPSQEHTTSGVQQPYKGPDYLPPLQPQQQLNAVSTAAPKKVISSSYKQQPQQHSGRRSKQLEEGVYKSPAFLPPAPRKQLKQIRAENYQVARQQKELNDARNSNFKAADYLPPATPTRATVASGTQQPFKGPDYLPPVQEHGAQQSYQAPEYLPPSQHQQQHHQQQQQIATDVQQPYKGPDYLPPSLPEQPFKGPDYLPPVQQQVNGGAQQAFQGPDYLPPAQQPQQQQQIDSDVQQPYSGPGYLPPAQEQVANGIQQPYKGPDYLPPTQQQVASVVQQPFKGPDYLPPQTETYSNAAVQSEGQATPEVYQAPAYLPPPAPQQQQPQQHQQQLSQPAVVQQQTPFKGSAYLPPSGAPAQPASSDAYSAPAYLPPGYDFANPEQPQQQQVKQHPLPQPAPQLETVPPPTQSSSSLPQGYEFNRPENAEQAIAELHGLKLEQQVQQQQQNEQHQQQDVAVQSHVQVEENDQAPEVIYGHVPQAPATNNGYLPPQPQSTVASGAPTQASYQVQQGNVQQLSSQQQYGAPGYLPPSPTAATVATVASVATQMHSLSSYMTAVQPFERYGATRYTEPRQPFAQYGPPPGSGTTSSSSAYQQVQQQQQQQQQSVQPFRHSAPVAAIEVAPMFREQSAQPQVYAPAMSYRSANAEIYRSRELFLQTFRASQPQQQQQQHQQPQPQSQTRPQPQPQPQPTASYGLNAQAKQTLQRLMPKEIHFASQNIHRQQQQVQQQQQQQQPQQQHILASTAQAPTTAVTTLPTAALPAVGKIRTVQIINPHAAVKTLKVLETSDQAGVKTIQILGTSNESPMGEHRVVNVVSPSADNAQENHVQTVKIYDDHKEAAAGGNEYLPPRARRNAKHKAEGHKRSSRNSKRRRNSGRSH